jgi:hypothetical protein
LKRRINDSRKAQGRTKLKDLIGDAGNAGVVLLDPQIGGQLVCEVSDAKTECHKVLSLLMIGVLLTVASGGLHARQDSTSQTLAGLNVSAEL